MRIRLGKTAAQQLGMVVCLIATVHTADGAKRVTTWSDQVAADKPAAWWRFEADSSELKAVGNVKFVPGPDKEVSTNLPAKNRAAAFDGDGDYLAVADSPELRFDHGDAITVEAWVRLDRLTSNAYIVGKGRTGHRDNQNWALRLMNVNGGGRISFLFRSRGGGDTPQAFHRWNSNARITPGPTWHHVAVAYRFGEPSSIRGSLDGEPTQGVWDLGGATRRPPVVDDGAVWIGSARGGAASNSFAGVIDEVVVHRRLLPAKVLAARVDFGPGIAPIDWDAVSPGQVRVEVSGNLPVHAWPKRVSGDPETFTVPALALLDLPPTYTNRASRQRRTTHLVRMAGRLSLSAGKHRLLLRAPSLARVRVDGQVIAELGRQQFNSDAHQAMRPPAPPTPYPRARLGTHDRIVNFTSSGTTHRVLVEAVVGHAKKRFTLGELLLAHQAAGRSQWVLATPQMGAPVFTPAGFEAFRQEQVAALGVIADQRRAAARARREPQWRQRHEAARTYVRALPPIPVPKLPEGFEARNPVDHFLAARIHAAQQAQAHEDPQAAVARRALRLLASNCFRCHGKKDKGELRLDTRPAALAAGESGRAAIVPGAPAKSEILRRLRSHDEDERMPPKGERLDANQIAAVETWIRRGAAWADPAQGISIPPPLPQQAFLRRLYLDTVGIFPTPKQIRGFVADPAPDKVERLIDALLAHPRHADHWTGYWQDVLAENPRLVKGKLNNTGPFRWWIHEALRDKLPFDQFVRDLIAFDGSDFEGGAAGFKVATQNDAPAAAKAHVLATAFLGTEMKCARCHDAPYHASTQEDLFSLAAMLEHKPLKVPATSSVPATFFQRLGDRKPLVKVTLKPGTTVQPAWPFDLAVSQASVLPPPASARDRLGWELTRPENHRFAQVIVNRIWKRYFGQGLVEPADDWEGHEPSHPQLLDYLARELVAHGYDLDHISKLILHSAAYRRTARPRPASAQSQRLFEAPLRRRLSAEQLIDSLFAASGVPVYSEELTFDLPGSAPASTFTNLGRPTRAWQFVSLASDRDRPSLTLPRAESIVSVMKAFGWRADRSQPVTQRQLDANVLQPGMLGNGVFATWISRPSPYSDLTALAVHAISVDALTQDLYLRFLGREPTGQEQDAFTRLLTPGFDTRVVRPASSFRKQLHVPPVREVSWHNHLRPKANVYASELERAARQGPPASDWLEADWRGRLEDAVWALINSPEMQFVP